MSEGRQPSEPCDRIYVDTANELVTFVLDQRSAEVAVYAIRALAADYEAHAREVGRVAESLPPESYGAINRACIAARHERIAGRLRAIEVGYRMATSALTATGQPLQPEPDREVGPG